MWHRKFGGDTRRSGIGRDEENKEPGDAYRDGEGMGGTKEGE